MAIGILALLMMACAPSTKFMRYTDESYTPTTNVEVLRAKPIQRNFIELGEVSVRSTGEDAVLYLKRKAMSIGADAIVIIGESSDGSVAVPVGNMYAIVNNKYLKALAIKYKK